MIKLYGYLLQLGLLIKSETILLSTDYKLKFLDLKI